MNSLSLPLFHYTKAQWRQWARATCISLGERMQARVPSQQRYLEAFLEANPSYRRLCLYMPTRYEVNLTGLVSRFPERSFYFPRMQAHYLLSWHRLYAHQMELPECWEPSKTGTLQEPSQALHLLEGVPDLVILPCLMMDMAGHRLGYGGGYYDRQLAAWRRLAQETESLASPPRLIGVLLEACLVPSLPHQAHDLPLHAWCTEQGIAGCRTF